MHSEFHVIFNRTFRFGKSSWDTLELLHGKSHLRMVGMTDDLNTYTGVLVYRDIEFTFVFDGEDLRLIPPAEKHTTIRREWLMTPLGNGAYSIGDLPTIKEPTLKGYCNETGRKLIFYTRVGTSISSYNSILFIPIVAYIVCQTDEKDIDKITFVSPEIDCIYPTCQAVKITFDEDISETGVFSVTTKDYEDTTTESQTFTLDEKSVTIHFGISRNMSTQAWKAPISLNSTMVFEFEPTNDYVFVFNLWKIAKQLIQFLCYRENVYLPEVVLSTPAENGKHKGFATMYILNEDGDNDLQILRKGRYIKHCLISGSEGRILSDIASGEVYLRHLPQNYHIGRRIDAARFVMITAAFECEFHRSYPDGIKKNEATEKAEDTATEILQQLVNVCSRKLKKIFKFLIRLVSSTSLQNEILEVGTDLIGIIDPFGQRLYSINHEKLVYAEMGQRLAEQRNHFAHGDLDKDFIGLSLLDLMYLEYIIYALQLKHYGIDTKNIQRAINDLFHCGIAL